MKAVITIFDLGDNEGRFQLDVDYGEEFNESSHAHRFATILLRAADQLAANLGMPEDAATLEEMKGAQDSEAK